MHTTTVLEDLKMHPFCEGLAPEHIELLASFAKKEEFPEDTVLFREGQLDTRFFLVLSGLVALEISSIGRVHRIQTLSAGDEVGWSTLMPSSGKNFDARAIKTVRAIVVDGVKLREACEKDPAFGYAIISRMFRIVAERLQATRLQLLDVYGGAEKVK